VGVGPSIGMLPGGSGEVAAAPASPDAVRGFVDAWVRGRGALWGEALAELEEPGPLAAAPGVSVAGLALASAREEAAAPASASAVPNEPGNGAGTMGGASASGAFSLAPPASTATGMGTAFAAFTADIPNQPDR